MDGTGKYKHWTAYTSLEHRNMQQKSSGFVWLGKT